MLHVKYRGARSNQFEKIILQFASVFYLWFVISIRPQKASCMYVYAVHMRYSTHLVQRRTNEIHRLEYNLQPKNQSCQTNFFLFPVQFTRRSLYTKCYPDSKLCKLELAMHIVALSTNVSGSIFLKFAKEYQCYLWQHKENFLGDQIVSFVSQCSASSKSIILVFQIQSWSSCSWVFHTSRTMSHSFKTPPSSSLPPFWSSRCLL